jgi:two-component system response regulator
MAIEVLMVDDDPGDVELTVEMMNESKLKINLNVVNDGIEAMAYLRKEGKYADATKPDLILLDLNMPRKDGREVLFEVKQDANLKNIPIVVLTTSDAEADISKSYTLGAACYVTKPVGLEQFSKVVESIENFWFTVVKYAPFI